MFYGIGITSHPNRFWFSMPPATKIAFDCVWHSLQPITYSYGKVGKKKESTSLCTYCTYGAIRIITNTLYGHIWDEDRRNSDCILWKSSSLRVVGLPREVVTATSILELRKYLENAIKYLVYFFWWSCLEPGVGLNDLCGSKIQFCIFCDSMIPRL